MIVASLPMYDWPEVRTHADHFWQGLLRHAGQTGALDRSTDYAELWRNPLLAFSQTCGYPFTHEFNGLMNYIATPHYAADGCEGANYCSIIFAREVKPLAEFYSSTIAINAMDSMSGMLAARLVFTPFEKSGEFFRRTKITGGHRNSLAAVRTKFADVCAIDSVCVALAKKYCPQELEGLVEIARSPQVPGLPFVTRQNPNTWRNALLKAFTDPELDETRHALLLAGVSILPDHAYNQILELERGL
jgi:ABC-type phosphate/phosphonate transport system substrate-binding protein